MCNVARMLDFDFEHFNLDTVKAEVHGVRPTQSKDVVEKHRAQGTEQQVVGSVFVPGDAEEEEHKNLRSVQTREERARERELLEERRLQRQRQQREETKARKAKEKEERERRAADERKRLCSLVEQEDELAKLERSRQECSPEDVERVAGNGIQQSDFSCSPEASLSVGTVARLEGLAVDHHLNGMLARCEDHLREGAWRVLLESGESKVLQMHHLVVATAQEVEYFDLMKQDVVPESEEELLTESVESDEGLSDSRQKQLTAKLPRSIVELVVSLRGHDAGNLPSLVDHHDAPVVLKFSILSEIVLNLHLDTDQTTPHGLTSLWEEEWGVAFAHRIRFAAPQGFASKWLQFRTDFIPVAPAIVRLEAHGSILNSLIVACKLRARGQCNSGEKSFKPKAIAERVSNGRQNIFRRLGATPGVKKSWGGGHTDFERFNDKSSRTRFSKVRVSGGPGLSPTHSGYFPNID